jgi:hypothetical protein
MPTLVIAVEVKYERRGNRCSIAMLRSTVIDKRSPITTQLTIGPGPTFKLE